MMSVLAWHFLPRDRRLAYGDGRLIRKGRRLHVEGEPILCKHGMHGSRRLIDALSYASGPVIERVEIGVDKPYKIVEGQDKLVGNWRKTLWWIDSTTILHEFACREAEDALRDAGVTDVRYWNAIRVKRLWIQGRATNEELNAAQAAANDAAWDVLQPTWDVMHSATCAAAAAAISDAVCVADRVAVAAADHVASWAIVWNTARARQNRRLIAMVCAAHRKEWRNG